MSSDKDILVVDDDPDMVDVLLRVLRLSGYAARSAENGKRALEAVAEHKPALVLLDMLMPVMDGWACARELRARYGQSLPIVVVTAAENARSRGVDVGADEALSKPFELEELMRIVAHYVGPASERTRS